MAINSKNDICNLALSNLASAGTVNDIDVPISKIETIFALWYDISRQNLLKLAMPNFALARRIVAQSTTAPTFGWTYAYEYPNDCLKLLGIGEVSEKENNYAVEGDFILTDCAPTNGLQIRFIQDIEDVNSMSPEFKICLSWVLAAATALPITQDINKKKLLEAALPSKITEMSGVNAQENRPIRISRSRFKEARFTNWPGFQVKR